MEGKEEEEKEEETEELIETSEIFPSLPFHPITVTAALRALLERVSKGGGGCSGEHPHQTCSVGLRSHLSRAGLPRAAVQVKHDSSCNDSWRA